MTGRSRRPISRRPARLRRAPHASARCVRRSKRCRTRERHAAVARACSRTRFAVLCWQRRGSPGWRCRARPRHRRQCGDVQPDQCAAAAPAQRDDHPNAHGGLRRRPHATRCLALLLVPRVHRCPATDRPFHLGHRRDRVVPPRTGRKRPHAADQRPRRVVELLCGARRDDGRRTWLHGGRRPPMPPRRSRSSAIHSGGGTASIRPSSAAACGSTGRRSRSSASPPRGSPA